MNATSTKVIAHDALAPAARVAQCSGGDGFWWVPGVEPETRAIAVLHASVATAAHRLPSPVVSGSVAKRNMASHGRRQVPRWLPAQGQQQLANLPFAGWPLLRSNRRRAMLCPRRRCDR